MPPGWLVKNGECKHMLSPFKHESKLVCTEQELSTILYEADIPRKDLDKYIILSSPIRIVECNRSMLIVALEHMYHTDSDELVSFLIRIAKTSLKYSDLSCKEQRICRNLVAHNIARLTENQTIFNDIRLINFSRNLNPATRMKKLGWFPCIPILVDIYISNKCNQECIHCFMESSRKQHITVSNSELLRKFVLELAELGTPIINFYGGEPFLLPGLVQICEEAKKAGVSKFNISTNGTLIKKSEIAKMATVIKEIQVTLLSSEKDQHNRLVNLTGAFELATENVRLMIKAGMKVKLAFPVMKLNADKIEKMALLAADLGTNLRYEYVSKEGRATHMDHFSTHEEEIISQKISIIMRKFDGEICIQSDFPDHNPTDISSTIYGCHAARNNLTLFLEEKRLAACVSDTGVRYVGQKIVDVWNQQHFDQFRILPKCDCSFDKLCSGPCPLNNIGS